MNTLEEFKRINTIILDVDGVLTNSELIILENGSLLRKMNVRDGYAIKAAINAGIRICIITGGKSSGVVQRLKGLGVKDMYLGISDKLEAFEEILYTYDLDPTTIAYMGDDIPDYNPMRRVEMPACPSNAAPEILAIAQYISPLKGGEGCVRDFIEKILRIQGKWIVDPRLDLEISGH